jgi:hypothetical protein
VLKDVLWLPEAPHILISETLLLLEGYNCRTKGLVRTFYDKTGKTVVSGSVPLGEGATGLFNLSIQGVGSKVNHDPRDHAPDREVCVSTGLFPGITKLFKSFNNMVKNSQIWYR